MPISLEQISAKIPGDHCRQVTAEYYITALSADLKDSASVIDIGAGDGRSFDLFNRVVNKLDWVGIDIADSPEVKSRSRVDCHFETFDGVTIPFDAASFDIAYSRQVFEHVRFPEGLLGEISRVLKPGGIFIGSVSQLEPFHSYSLWNFTYYGFATLCADAGLELVEFRPGVDGFSLCFRHLTLFWLRQNVGALFESAVNIASPVNSYIENLGRAEKRDQRRINLDKITYCGHLCFKFRKAA